MWMTDRIDSGISCAVTMDGKRATFHLAPRGRFVHVLLRDVPREVILSFQLDEEGVKHLARQGIIVSEDGVNFTAHPLVQNGQGEWEAVVRPRGDRLQVATRYPYGRDGLDRLLCDVHGASLVRPRLLSRDHRSMLLFDAGEDDGSKPIHYILAGEDVDETSAHYAADEMVRMLARGGEGVERLLAKSVVRIVPLVSTFCAGRPGGESYTALNGDELYMASRWTDDQPPPELALVRDEVEQAVVRRRLGLFLAVHSWQALRPVSTLQAIRTAGSNSLSPERAAEAERIMETLIRDVPKGNTELAERIWHPGLARDYLLGKHNIVTFRIEVTTDHNGIAEFRETGRRLLENMADVSSWEGIYP